MDLETISVYIGSLLTSLCLYNPVLRRARNPLGKRKVKPNC